MSTPPEGKRALSGEHPTPPRRRSTGEIVRPLLVVIADEGVPHVREAAAEAVSVHPAVSDRERIGAARALLADLIDPDRFARELTADEILAVERAVALLLPVARRRLRRPPTGT